MIRRTAIALFAAAALAACGSEPEPVPAESSGPTPSAAAEPPAAPSPAPLPSAITDPALLVGEYRVSGVGGQDIDLPHGITASISDAGIHVVSDCVNLSWSWSLEGARLVTERVPVESCGRGLLPKEDAIAAAFDGATGVVRTPSNGVEFTGENGSVLLFSQ
jgi:hypothetical protein